VVIDTTPSRRRISGSAETLPKASPDGRPRSADAATILDQRLAAGEIDIERYENARAALGLPSGNGEGELTD
jgi:hypothetical protein